MTTDRELLRDAIMAIGTSEVFIASDGHPGVRFVSEANMAERLLDGPLAPYIALAEAERALDAIKNVESEAWCDACDAAAYAIDALPSLDGE